MSYRVCGKDIKKSQISPFPLLISVLGNSHNASFFLTGLSASVYWHLFSSTWANWGCMERKMWSASFEIIPSLTILLPQKPFTVFFLTEIFLCNMWILCPFSNSMVGVAWFLSCISGTFILLPAHYLLSHPLHPCCSSLPAIKAENRSKQWSKKMMFPHFVHPLK